MPSLVSRICCRLLAAPLLAMPVAAFAGPPFLTDDPQPTELHHWEIYDFVSGEGADGQTSLAGGLDLNYGAVRDVQLTVVLPLEKEPGLPLHGGDIELAAKFRFLDHRDRSVPVDVSFFPRVFLPTGRDSHRTRLLLPLWVEHDAGAWQIFGGGGYTLNPGPGQRDYWQQGVAVNRAINERLQLGLEYFGQQADVTGGRATHLLNLGATLRIGGPFSLLGSFGRGLNRRQTVFYSALKFDL
ncbi:MAG: hypothetical protein KGM18_06470 [Sphingomonadales bacterium]|nr:hypothetical protein [Sphingomonadales bacterium]